MKKFSTLQNIMLYEPFEDSRFKVEKNPLFYRGIDHAYIPPATAPPVEMDVSSDSFHHTVELFRKNKFYHFILYGSYK